MSEPHSIPPTGVPDVDAAAARLADLDDGDVHQHPAVFEDVHQRLTAALDTATDDPPQD